VRRHIEQNESVRLHRKVLVAPPGRRDIRSMPSAGYPGVAPPDLERALERVDEDFESHLQTIRAYLKQPSVSGTGEGIEECAEHSAGLIEMAGGEAEIVPTEGHPAVVGVVGADGPRLLRYGMYDVQPAEEDTWTSGPFEAAVRDLPGIGPSIVGRGSANSKGCLAAFFCALSSARAVADLPIEIPIVLDGEEELGSPSLPGVFKSHRDKLQAEAGFDLDLTADLDGTPWVTLGCKGIVSLKVGCRGGAWGGPTSRALHSSNGVVVRSPVWSLVKALDALVDSDERPALQSTAAVEIPTEDEELIDSLAHKLDLDVLREEHDIERLKTEDPRAAATALVYEAAININGLASGYMGGGKTIIPNESAAVIDIRVPFGVGLEEVAEEATALLKAAAPEVEVEAYELCPAAKTPSNSPVATTMIESHRASGDDPLVWPSAPWWAPLYLFDQYFNIPFASGGAGHASRAHAADEYATVEGLRAHMRQSLNFLWMYAAAVRSSL
jgi:acetylornithine deacetylase/succinyl-diaminopimelate desuccinylase-like protein